MKLPPTPVSERDSAEPRRIRPGASPVVWRNAVSEVPLLRTTLITLVSLVLLLGFAACGGGDDEAAEPEEGPAPTTTAEGADTEPTTTAEGTDTGDAAAGAEVFASAGCADCHTLAAAEASGSVGPNLDELQPSFETVVRQVTNGGGGMPAFEGELTEQQIRDVAAFVAENAGG